jgi:hypothetical protein
MRLDSTFSHENEDFSEFKDVTKFLDSLKEDVSDATVNSILNFAKAYRVLTLDSSHNAEVIIN